MTIDEIIAAEMRKIVNERNKLRREVEAMRLADGLNRDAYETLRAEVARLRAALEAVEWIAFEWGGWADTSSCPWCVNEEAEGHKPDCARQLALGIVKPRP